MLSLLHASSIFLDSLFVAPKTQRAVSSRVVKLIMVQQGKQKAVEESSATSHVVSSPSDLPSPTPKTPARVEAQNADLSAVAADSSSDLQYAPTKDPNNHTPSPTLVTSMPLSELVLTSEFKVAYDTLMGLLDSIDLNAVDPDAEDKATQLYKLAILECCRSNDLDCKVAYCAAAELWAKSKNHFQGCQSKDLATKTATGSKDHHKEISELKDRITKQDSALFSQSRLNNRMNQTVGHVAGQLFDLTIDGKLKDHNIVEKRAKLVKKNAKLVETEAECKRLGESLHKMSEEKEDFEEMKRDVARAEAKTKTRDQEIKRLEGLMDQTGTRKLEDEIKELKKTIKEGNRAEMAAHGWDKVKKALQGRIEKLEKSLRDKNKSYDALKAEWAKKEAEYKSRVEELEAEVRRPKGKGKGRNR